MFLLHTRTNAIHFQAQWKWKGGHPLSFQQYQMSFQQYLNIIFTSYDCLQTMTTYEFVFPYEYDHLSKCTRIPSQKMKYTFDIHQIIKKTCTSMLFSNLAEPKWVFIPCNESFLNIVVCVKDKNIKNNNSYTLNIVKKNNICLKQYLKINEKCYKLSWISRNSSKSLQDICEKHEKQVNSYQRSVLEKALNLVSQKGQFPPILALYFHRSKMKISKLTYKRFLGQLYFKSEFVSSFEAEGFFLCNAKGFTVIISSNLFPCNAGGYISYEYVCDGLIDCPNDISDEKNIACIKYGIEVKILNSEEHNRNHKCSNLYLLTISGTCQKYTSLEGILKQGFIKKLTINIYRNLTYFKCKNTTLIHSGIFNDPIANCGLYAVNKFPLGSKYYDKNKTLTLCNKPHEIPCQDGSSECFQLQDTCLYSLNSYGTLSFCRNGGHLDNCVYYECDTMFKCQSSYCIPWSYVCDGKWDCPHGFDETYNPVCTSNETCLGMYKCFKSSRKCLHIQNVCDGHVDCPYGDDESICELDQIRCPSQCTCLLLAMECVNTTLNLKCFNCPHISVYISNVVINSLQFIFHQFKTCLLFKAPRNNLKHICGLSSNKMLFYLSLDHNLINNIEKNCFAAFPVLKHLRLDNNCIVVISFGSFNNLPHLQSLNISNNPLVKIPDAMLKHTPQFEMLYALNTIPKDFSMNSLWYSSLKLIVSSDYHYCCIAPLNTICLPSKPSYFSCNDLLPNAKLNILFVAGATLVILPNTLSIILNIFISKTNQKSQTPFTMIVTAINLTDTLCGIVLGIIWIVNKKFEGVFLLKEVSWRSSSLCFVIFGTVVWFTLLSQLNLILLSLSRLNVVLYPMTSIFKDTEFVSKILYSVFTFTFVTSLMVMLFTKYIHKMMPLSLCLPFLDPTGSCLTN